MVLSDKYSNYVTKAIEELEHPDKFSIGFAGLYSLLKTDEAIDVAELARAAHYDNVYKQIGIDLKQTKEFLTGDDQAAALDRIVDLLRRALPYPLWPYLASVETLRMMYRYMGQDT